MVMVVSASLAASGVCEGVRGAGGGYSWRLGSDIDEAVAIHGRVAIPSPTLAIRVGATCFGRRRLTRRLWRRGERAGKLLYTHLEVCGEFSLRHDMDLGHSASATY